MSVDPAGLESRETSLVPKLHFPKAAAYSLGGFRRLLRERAFREELAFLIAILGLFFVAKVGRTDYVVQIVLFLVLASAEALNTAIEMLVDRVSPEISSFAEQAKDLGSFAVFCLLCANGGYACFALAGRAI